MLRTGLLALMLMVAGVAGAAPVFVTFEGTGSGTLAGVPFMDSAFRIEMTGDTSATFAQYRVIWLPSTSAHFFIPGVGGGAIVGTINAWISDTGAGAAEGAGFSDASLRNMIWSYRSGVGLAGYDWTSDFGPTDIMEPDGTANTQPWAATTVAGDLAFTSATRTFVMEVRGNPAVPEPASVILLGTGLGVIGLAAWRRKK